MRSVNANLFEINQAKSRIKAAVKAGETPDPAEEALVATEKQNAYAIAQYADVMTIEKFAKHISTHGCVYSRADISAILYMAVDCMREQLLEGKKIRLGDLGDFSVSLTSKGAETAKAFTTQNITGVNVVWECGQEFKNLLADAEFNLVASRSAQAAVLKAVKAGETVVDLNAKTEGDGGDGGDDTDPSNPSNPSNPSGGNTGGGSTNRQYTISVTSANTDQGTVTGGGTYSEGSRVNISATPKAGYQFDKWNDGNTSSVRTINVSKDESFVAQFKVADSTEPGGSGDDDTPDYI